ncbi:glycosyltransferase [Candidatus Woesearchaeota archaeon]|nr:glycosyltransferase [Candidatus Woesearchaeota archaeon]
MHEIIFITDIDLSKQKGAGIALYVKNLCRFISAKKTIIGKNKHALNIKAEKFIGIDNANSNYSFLFKLLKLEKSFISENAVLVSQRPDFMYPFLKLENRKIITIHGNPAKLLLKKKGLFTYLAYKFLEKKSLANADKVIFIDSQTYKEYIKKYSWIESRSEVIPPGVDTSVFKKQDRNKARKRMNLPLNAKIMLFTGRIEPEKNVNLIVNEFKNIPDKDYLLLIAGQGRDYKKISKLAEDDDRIKLFYGIEHEKVPMLMNAADALLLMSYSEGLPTVILEALSCGTPVIARNVGDIDKLVISDKTGYLTEFGDIKENFEKILAKKKWEKECVRLAKTYSWKNISKKLIEIYLKWIQ